MILLTVLVLGISVFEIWNMVKKKQKKEIVVFVVIAALTLAIGYIYISDPSRESLAQCILRVFGIEF